MEVLERLDDVAELIDTLRKASRHCIHRFVVDEMRSHRADDEHRAILAACRTRDPSRRPQPRATTSSPR
jgi:DNA-binding GntR family transcriptional regulator